MMPVAFLAEYDVTTVDEWLKFCMEYIITKVATFLPYPILDHGIEEVFKAFVEAALVHLMFSRDVSPPATTDGGCHGAKEQDNSPPVKAGGDYIGTKEQDVPPVTMDNGISADVSRDVSSSAKADGGGSAAKEGAEVHYQLLMAASPSSGYRQEDVSPPTTSDGGLHGAKEEGEE